MTRLNEKNIADSTRTLMLGLVFGEIVGIRPPRSSSSHAALHCRACSAAGLNSWHSPRTMLPTLDVSKVLPKSKCSSQSRKNVSLICDDLNEEILPFRALWGVLLDFGELAIAAPWCQIQLSAWQCRWGRNRLSSSGVSPFSVHRSCTRCQRSLPPVGPYRFSGLVIGFRLESKASCAYASLNSTGTCFDPCLSGPCSCICTRPIHSRWGRCGDAYVS